MKKIVVTSKKGGVGKTTGAVNIADHLARVTKKRVLVIDLDPQGNATYYLSGGEDAPNTSLAEVFQEYKKMSLDDIIQPTICENVYLAPADDRLDKTNKWLITERRNTEVLQKLLDKMERHFDYVIFDCPPTATLIYENAIMVADRFLVPVDVSNFSLKGLITQIIDIEDVLDRELDIPFDVYINAVDKRLSTTKKVDEILQKELPEFYNKSLCVRVCEEVRKAQFEFKSIRDFKKGDPVNNDYVAIARRIA